MKWHLKNMLPILRDAAIDFDAHKSFRMSAALAYYTVFSIAPMLIVIISLCDFFYGRAAIEGTIFKNLQDFIGTEAAAQIEQVIRNAAISNDLSWASFIGVCALIFAATGVFAEIQDSINFIWRLKAKPKKGFLKMILNRVISFSMVVSISFILLVSLIINSVLDLLGQQLIVLFPGSAIFVAHFINTFISFTTISTLFAIIFKVLPDAKIQWRDVLTGAIATAILFMLGKFIIGYYLGKTHISSTYGAAGSVVIILAWVYYSASILYYGACFTRAYAIRTGRNIFPDEYAVWIQEIELENKASLQMQGHPILTNTRVSPEFPKVEETKD